MGKLWGVDTQGRDDATKRFTKALNAKREEALDRLTENQKSFALVILTDNLGLDVGELCGFMIDMDTSEYVDCPYEDLADAEEDLAIKMKAVEEKR